MSSACSYFVTVRRNIFRPPLALTLYSPDAGDDLDLDHRQDRLHLDADTSELVTA